MKAVILEDYAIQQGDLDWSGVEALVPDVTRYGRTAPEEVVPRIGDAEIVFLNKCRIDENVLARCPKLRWVGIIATGTDNLDLQACRRHGVAVANVPGYSTHSVAQMTFSLLLAICQCADRYDRLVQDGRWRTEDPAAYRLLPQVELLGKTFGIYGYGSIGRQTARIARAFGMDVLVCTRTVRPEYAADGVEFVDFDALLARSDVLSLHCPATPATRGLVNADSLAKAKPGMILLNTARGALVDEQAVADALKNGQLAFLRCRRILHRAVAAGKSAAGPAQRPADAAHRMGHQRSSAAADGHYHQQPAHMAGWRRREHCERLKQTS